MQDVIYVDNGSLGGSDHGFKWWEIPSDWVHEGNFANGDAPQHGSRAESGPHLIPRRPTDREFLDEAMRQYEQNSRAQEYPDPIELFPRLRKQPNQTDVAPVQPRPPIPIVPPLRG